MKEVVMIQFCGVQNLSPFIVSDLTTAILEENLTIEDRSDDDSDTIIRRYEKYMETTQPVLNFYSQKPNFKEIDGGLEIEEITSDYQQQRKRK